MSASFIISILMSPLLGTGLPYGLHIGRMGCNPPHGSSAVWLVLTTVNAARTNALTCLPKHSSLLFIFKKGVLKARFAEILNKTIKYQKTNYPVMPRETA
jgi:hypothetical protein